MVSDANNKQELLELVQKAIAGSETAFGEIYDLYFEKVYRFIFYRVNHRETAEDLVAETFIRAFKKLAEMENAGAFNGWIYQIARNLVIDHYRSRKETVDLSLLENVLEYEDNIVDHADLEIAQKTFLQLVKKLSPDQQIVIKLKFFDDLGNEEIAQILNKSEGAIRVIQHRALAELKNLLDQNDQ